MKAFRYTMNSALAQLFSQTVIDYNGSDKIIGYMDDGTKSLVDKALYAVCSLDNDKNGKNIYSNAIAVIARTDSEAIEMYHDITKRNDGTVLCMLEEKLQNLKVERV